MAEPQILYFDQRAVLVKLESVADTDPVLNPTMDGFLFYDGSTGTEFDKIERNPDRPFWGGNPFKVANKRGFIEGNVDLIPPSGPGTTGALCKPLLLPAGFAEVLSVPLKSARYNPISSAIPAAWSRFYQGGEEITLQSARHTLNAVTLAIGAGAEYVASSGWSIDGKRPGALTRTLGSQLNAADQPGYRVLRVKPDVSGDAAAYQDAASWQHVAGALRRDPVVLAIVREETEEDIQFTSVYGAATSIPTISHAGGQTYALGELVVEEIPG